MIDEHERAEARRTLDLCQAVSAAQQGGQPYEKYQTNLIQKINRTPKMSFADRMAARSRQNQNHG